MKSYLVYPILFALFFYTSKNVHSKSWYVGKTESKNSTNGTRTNPFKAISEAASIAIAGDTIWVSEGIYRERVAPANGGQPGKPVVYKVVPGQKVVIKGSEVWQNKWKRISDNVYASKLDLTKLKDYNPYFIPLARMQGRKSLGQIFCNGYNLTQVDSLEQVKKLPGTWMLSYDSTSIVINYPENLLNCPIELCEVEYTTRGKVFAPHKRGLGYIHVEGFVIEHCANQFPSGFYHEKGFPQSGAISARSGHHWTIRGNTIRYAKSLAIDCGYEGAYDNEGSQPMPDPKTIGYHLIEHNTITDCGAGGIAGATQRGTVIRYNRIDRTNNLGFTAPETGAIKVHFFYDGLIEGNVFCDNDCSAIWLDNEWYNSRVTRNVIIQSSGHGIFVEMGEGKCMVDNNIVAYTRCGDGIYTHDASGVTFAHNLLLGNAHFGMYMRVVTDRTAKNEAGIKEVVTTRNQKILNNIFIDNYRGHISLPVTGEKVHNNVSDYNLFINGTQWQWEASPFYSFSINKNNGSPLKKREEELKKIWFALGKIDRKELNDTSVIVSKRQQPLVSFEQWKLLTGMDDNSQTSQVKEGTIQEGAIANGDVSLSAMSLELVLRNTAPFTVMKCPVIEGLKWDFYGNEISGNTTYPGPFASYKSTRVNYFLFPPIITHNKQSQPTKIN